MAAGARLPHLKTLDGLRALAVVGVVFYHADVAWARGGFLGVDVFFVVSGYLITALLLQQVAEHGRIGLRGFWGSRARRLLPALGLMVAVALLYAVVVLPGEARSLGWDAVAAAGFVTNWQQVFAERSYFEMWGRPPALQHLWSLAVEEQFYVVWPLVVAVLARKGGAKAVGLVALAGAVASVGLMAWLYQPGLDPSRLYYGTDTRAAGLLLGAALAVVWKPWATVRTGEPRAGVGFALDVLGLTLLAFGAAAVVLVDATSPALYLGGFGLVAVAAAALIAAAVHPEAVVMRQVLGGRVLGWLGRRSYAIYLWHWPVAVVTRPGEDIARDGWDLLLVRVGLTLLLAELSYRVVEEPVRSGRVARWWRERGEAGRTWRVLRGGPLLAGGAGMAALVVAVAASTPTKAPEWMPQGSVHLTFAAPEGVSVDEPNAESPALVESVASATVGEVGWPGMEMDEPMLVTWVFEQDALAAIEQERVVVAVAKGEMPAPRPAPAPAPKPGTRVLAVGDSVMLGAAYALGGALGSVEVDAAVGRQAYAAVGVVQAYARAGLPPVVVIQIGNNGTLTGGQIDSMMEALAGAKRVVFVTVRVERPWEAGNNAEIWAARDRWPQMVIADWYWASSGHPEYFHTDGVHMGGEGAGVYADLIANAVAAP